MQLEKLENKTKFLRKFWNSFEHEMLDLAFIKEESLAERAALSIIKSGEIRGAISEKILTNNEFIASCNRLEELKE